MSATGEPAPAPHRERPPTCWMLHHNRWWMYRLLTGWWDVRLHGAEHVPATGPVVLAANHIGFADGPLMGICSPRPVHALTKRELFVGPLGWLLRAWGQIPLDRFHADPAALRTCLRALENGRVVGVFPEGVRGDGELDRFHRGTAYLAMVAGAPVVPLVFFGTREPGRGQGSIPRRGSRVDLVYGAPYDVAAVPWPRTREHVAEVSLLLRRHLRDHLALAKGLTGRDLPGPLPPGAHDPDPATGVTDPGAP